MSGNTPILLELKDKAGKNTWEYQPLPKQYDFHSSKATFRLHVGGMGSGKTLNLLMEAIMTCIFVPGSNSLILRTTSPDIWKTVINQFLNTSIIPRALYKEFNKNEKIVYFNNGSQLHFGYCQRDDDVNQFLSTQYAFIGLEEAGEFTYRIFEHLVLRLRAITTLKDVQGNPVKPSIGLTTNPLGNGWPWIKTLFGCRNDGMNGQGRPVYGMGKYNPLDYFYIRSDVSDNPYCDTPEYRDKLQSATGSLRQQALYGDVEEVSGQAFPQFNTGQHEGIHIMEAKDITFRNYDPIWIGSDWDWDHWPVLWFRKGWIPDKLNGGLRCVNVCYRELLLREKNAVYAANEIARACPPNRPTGPVVATTEKIRAFFFSWERFKHQGTDHTIAEQLGTNLVKYGIPRPSQADNQRIDGWALIGQLLDLDELVVTTDCPYVIETLPVLTRSTDKIGDINKTESLEDDIADAFRYGLKSFLRPGRVPQAVKNQQVLDRIIDPYARQIKAFEQYCKNQEASPVYANKKALGWQIR